MQYTNSWLNVGRARDQLLVFMWTSPVLSPCTSCPIWIVSCMSALSILQLWQVRHLSRSHLCLLGTWDQLYPKHAVGLRKFCTLLYAWTAYVIKYTDLAVSVCILCSFMCIEQLQHRAVTILPCICIYPSASRRTDIFLYWKMFIWL